MKSRAVQVIVVAVLVLCAIYAGMAVAKAAPLLKCSPYVPFVGSWCDSNWQPDGSYLHCLDSWGGLDCSVVCTMEGNPVNPPLAPNGYGSCGRPENLIAR